MVLRNLAIAADLVVDIRPVQNRRQVDTCRLPLLDGLLRFETVGAANHLIDGVEAQLCHNLAHVLCDKAQEINHMVGVAGKFLTQLRVLRRHTHGAGIEMADPHHNATHSHQRAGRETEFFGPQQRGDNHVAASLELAIGLDDDATAQVVEHQRLVRLGQSQLPRQTSVFYTGLRRSASATIVARNQHHVGMALGHPGGDSAYAELRN